MEVNDVEDGLEPEFQLSRELLDMVAMIQAKNEFFPDENQNTANSRSENWSLSQFWYTKETSDKLCEELIQLAKSMDRPVKVVFLSCPTIFEAMEKRKDVPSTMETHLYEYDSRFGENTPNYTLYDYNNPLEVPAAHANFFDIVVVDPPHLSDECAVQFAQTIRVVAKNKDSPIIYCSAAQVEEIVTRLLHVRRTDFHPEHMSKLGNIFCCYTNYEPKTFKWEEEDVE